MFRPKYHYLLLFVATLVLPACDSNEEDQCPAGPSTDQVDFFPLTAGDVWWFDYSSSSRDMLSSTREQGTRALTLGEPSCTGGIRTVTVSERTSGIHVNTWMRADGIMVKDTVSMDTTITVTFTETVEGVRIPWAPGLVPRYHPSTEDTIRVSVGPYGPVCGPGAASVTLVPGKFFEFSASCSHVSSGQSLHLVRIARDT